MNKISWDRFFMKIIFDKLILKEETVTNTRKQTTTIITFLVLILLTQKIWRCFRKYSFCSQCRELDKNMVAFKSG